MDSITQTSLLKTPCDKGLHLVEFRLSSCLKSTWIVKDKSWVVSKHHFILDIVYSALRTRHRMLPIIKNTPYLSWCHQHSGINLISDVHGSISLSTLLFCFAPFPRHCCIFLGSPLSCKPSGGWWFFLRSLFLWWGFGNAWISLLTLKHRGMWLCELSERPVSKFPN
jgi:hypothetical protein